MNMVYFDPPFADEERRLALPREREARWSWELTRD